MSSVVAQASNTEKEGNRMQHKISAEDGFGRRSGGGGGRRGGEGREVGRADVR